MKLSQSEMNVLVRFSSGVSPCLFIEIRNLEFLRSKLQIIEIKCEVNSKLGFRNLNIDTENIG